MNDFTVTVEQHPDRSLVAVAGELDLQTSPRLQDAVLAAPLGGQTLHLDLAEVSFMDSTGLNLLLRLRRRLRTEDGRLRISGLQDQPARLLHLTGTYELLTADDADPSDGSRRASARV
ncbi:STAS domain-containing protein [Streptomyces sp. NPDC018031]|uniref:STAS domain-containing protein n=1 Tax=Streptomyces sp. NPDC018031 TaxID=3365033 RepID=UPI003790C204